MTGTSERCGRAVGSAPRGVRLSRTSQTGPDARAGEAGGTWGGKRRVTRWEGGGRPRSLQSFVRIESAASSHGTRRDGGKLIISSLF